MCLKNNVELVQKVVHTKIISKFICSPENLVANEFQFQKHSPSSSSWQKTFTCTQNASSWYCNQFQLFSNHSASISEFCPNKPLTTSCCSHHASYIQKRSTCSPYARECIFPYPLLLRFPFIDSQNPVKSQKARMPHICIKLSSVQPPVRTCTQSRIFTPVADVLQKYLCTRISLVL